MKRNLLSFLKDPPLFVAAIVWPLSLAAIGGAIACVAADADGILCYVLYALAALGLGCSVWLAVRLAPRIREALRERIRRNKFTDSLVNDYGFRTAAFAAAGFAVNVGYALFDGIMAIAARSLWFGIFALYYLLLSGMRLGVLLGGHAAKKRADGEDLFFARLKIYRWCGAALLPLDLALAGAVTMMVLRQDPLPHAETAAIAAAAYAFYKIILAIINLCKARRLDDPALRALRCIGLTDAAVSLFALQITLVSVFSGDNGEEMLPMNAVTGFCVCALTLALGVGMIVQSYRSAKRRTENNEREHG